MRRAEGMVRARARLLAIAAGISLMFGGTGADAGGRESLATTAHASSFDFFEIVGVDAEGRLLLSGELNTGGNAFVWADGEDIVRISGSVPGLYPLRRTWSLVFSPGGRVATLAADSPSSERATAITILEPAPRRVVSTGDPTPEGDAICHLSSLAINDAGAVAFVAAIAAPGEDCHERERSGIYVTTDCGLRTEVTTDDFESPDSEQAFGDAELKLIALLRDGAVIFAVSEDLGDAPEGVVISRNRQARCLVGDDAPDGIACVFRPKYFVLASSPSGEVLLLDPPYAVWRSDRGLLRQVVARGDVLPNGAFVKDLTYGGAEGYLNSSGDALVLIDFLDPQIGTESYGSLLVPAGGSSPAMLPPYPRGLNDRGQIALLVLDHDRVAGDELSVAMRWNRGVVDTLYVEGHPVPDARQSAANGCSLSPNARQVSWPVVLAFCLVAVRILGLRAQSASVLATVEGWILVDTGGVTYLREFSGTDLAEIVDPGKRRQLLRRLCRRAVDCRQFASTVWGQREGPEPLRRSCATVEPDGEATLGKQQPMPTWRRRRTDLCFRH